MVGQTLIPLGVHQACLWAKENRSSLPKYLAARLVSLLTLVTMGGRIGAGQVVWLPR